MTDSDWARIGIEVAIAAATGFGSAVATAWRMGRSGAQERATDRADIEAKIQAVREDNGRAMDRTFKQAEDRNELLIEQFKETFEGLRRQLDDHRLLTERDFQRKTELAEFVKVYREDQTRYREDFNRLNDKIDKILDRVG